MYRYFFIVAVVAVAYFVTKYLSKQDEIDENDTVILSRRFSFGFRLNAALNSKPMSDTYTTKL